MLPDRTACSRRTLPAPQANGGTKALPYFAILQTGRDVRREEGNYANDMPKNTREAFFVYSLPQQITRSAPVWVSMT